MSTEPSIPPTWLRHGMWASSIASHVNSPLQITISPCLCVPTQMTACRLLTEAKRRRRNVRERGVALHYKYACDSKLKSRLFEIEHASMPTLENDDAISIDVEPRLVVIIVRYHYRDPSKRIFYPSK